MSRLMDEHRFNVIAMTPLHVGTGQELPPSDYVIRESRLYHIDHVAFFASLQGTVREEYQNLVDRGNYVGLRVFLARHAERPQEYGWMRAKVDRGVLVSYAENLKRPQAGMIIHPLLRGGAQRSPLIPGSSIKGAMRTALLNHRLDVWVDNGMTDRRKIDTRKVKPRQVEADLLGFGDKASAFDRDPLGVLKVADLEVPDAECTKTWLMEVQNLVPETGAGKAGFDLSYEVLTVGELGELRISLWAGNAHRPGLKMEEVLEACNSFYLRQLRQERKQFYAGGKHKEADQVCQGLEEEAEGLKGKGCLLRVGRFSHREYLTLTGKGEGAGKTRNLLQGRTPMGWMILERAA